MGSVTGPPCGLTEPGTSCAWQAWSVLLPPLAVLGIRAKGLLLGQRLATEPHPQPFYSESRSGLAAEAGLALAILLPLLPEWPGLQVCPATQLPLSFLEHGGQHRHCPRRWAEQAPGVPEVGAP